jgi:hypothetical protein
MEKCQISNVKRKRKATNYVRSWNAHSNKCLPGQIIRWATSKLCFFHALKNFAWTRLSALPTIYCFCSVDSPSSDNYFVTYLKKNFVLSSKAVCKSGSQTNGSFTYAKAGKLLESWFLWTSHEPLSTWASGFSKGFNTTLKVTRYPEGLRTLSTHFLLTWRRALTS